jgi:hypothetical protein
MKAIRVLALAVLCVVLACIRGFESGIVKCTGM